MIWTEMLTALKEATNTENFTNISDAKYYDWLTRSHKFVANKITSQIDSKYLYSIVKADAVNWQYKYDELPVKVIDTIFVKYKWDTDFRKTRPIDVSEMSQTIEWYAENQPKTKPLSFITNEIVMIFPAPDDDIVKGIYATGKKAVGDISATTTETEVFNGHEIDHQVIIDGAEQYVYHFLKEYDKKQESKDAFYNKWRLKQPWSLDSLISDLSYRWSQPVHYEEDQETLAWLL